MPPIPVSCVINMILVRPPFQPSLRDSRGQATAYPARSAGNGIPSDRRVPEGWLTTGPLSLIHI